jgi:hypothetical protein
MDERLAEASTAALVIVAVGLIPLIMASRAITKPPRENTNDSRATAKFTAPSTNQR